MRFKEKLQRCCHMLFMHTCRLQDFSLATNKVITSEIECTAVKRIHICHVATRLKLYRIKKSILFLNASQGKTRNEIECENLAEN